MGKPAARLTDMHVCPMVTPGLPPIPHVGGPITGPGCPTVLIGSMPAAVMGDMCVCVGPPSTIIMGSTGVFFGKMPAARMGDPTAHGGSIVAGLPTVMIGETSSGSAVGPDGGGNMGAMPVSVLQNVMNKMPDNIKDTIIQIMALKQAAENGSLGCEICMKNNPA